MSGVTVRAAGEADLAALLALRHEVFVLEQGVPAELESDDYDVTAAHVVAVDAGGHVVGTGRVYREAGQAYGDLPVPVGHIGRLAVARTARGKGIGAALVRALEDRARTLGLGAVVLGAQLHAVEFYRGLGYQPYGEVFDDAGIGHRWMRRRL